MAEKVTSQFWDDAQKLSNAAENYGLSKHPLVVETLNKILTEEVSSVLYIGLLFAILIVWFDIT